MSQVFLDTVGLIALWDQSDQWHSAAEQAFAKLAAEQHALLTSAYVLLECGNAAARRPYRTAVDRLREQLEHAGLLLWPTDDDWSSAWQAYAAGGAHDAGIVDHLSFALMRKHGISEVFTNDRHFANAGFTVLF